MDRGAARQDIFLFDQQRWRFIDLLAEISDRFEVEIHAYCLMGNHYHLMVRTPKANLARAMRHLNGVYAQHFNWSTHRDGPLFRGRYKAVPVQADAYWHYLSRYIHRNPLEAGITPELVAYPWSSYRSYVGAACCPEWLHTAAVLTALDAMDRPERYRAFVETAFGEEPVVAKYIRDGGLRVLGDGAFRKQLELT